MSEIDKRRRRRSPDRLTGPQGPQGPVGPEGPQGVQGLPGEVGPPGLTGEQGPPGLQGISPQGAVGRAGPAGPSGEQGPRGPAGLIGFSPPGPPGPPGPEGIVGLQGIQGPQGATGAQGETGATGDQGPVGPAGISADHAYIYNLTVQTINPGEDIPYDSNGIIFGSFTHVEGSADVIITNTGDYYAQFSVTGNDVNQFAFFLDDTLVVNTIYGSDDVNQQNFGAAIFTVDTAPAVLNVRYFNNVSINEVQLTTPAGGSASNVNASLFLQRLGEQVTVTVATSDELLAALNNESISRIILEPGIYDISGSPVIARTTAVRLQSPAPSATVTFNPNQEFNAITLGTNIVAIVNQIRNRTQGTTPATLPAAVAAANPGDVIELAPGTYVVPVQGGPNPFDPPVVQFVINKTLTIRGISAEQTNVVFVLTGGLPDFSYMSIRANDVILENIRWSGPTPTSGDQNSLFNIPAIQTEPVVLLYEGIILRYNIFEGGRRTAFIDTQDFTFIGNTVIHLGNRDGLVFERIRGRTLVYGNIFSGNASSRRMVSIEGPLAFDTIIINNNFGTSWTQFVLINAPTSNTSIFIQENYFNHEGLDGSTIIFLAAAANYFQNIVEILIEDNILIQQVAQRLAVFVDYRSGGTSAPSTGQIQIIENQYSYTRPWGRPTDTVSPIFPAGFSPLAPPGLQLTIFLIVNNEEIIPPPP
ncbi:collagen-like protein [Paenibacillus lemnae]|uniref:Collagen-like protein n=1 Tax=Paenibacillus lemnae TaxID=1330551 RepID=A0A848M6L8_PAELE|nr:collagen-like protein [Paenibacillus lemnae]NMO95851.1 hypothetical protein [Paenibacillus lemnae]